jgi:pimeloyl-ACP methyl ester carboxylesterase
LMNDFTERTLSIGGMEIAVKIYNSEAGGSPVLALHGWLDNAASFDAVAPLLDKIQLITLDLPGHGLSSHRPEGADYYIWSYVADVIVAADALSLDTFSLLGHSMGGAIACLISSLYPERVKKLALLDAIGPVTTAAIDAPAQMRKALKQKQGLKHRKLHYYSTFEAAIEARAKKGLSLESASILGSRGVRKEAQGYYWANDQRLASLSLLSMTEEQVNAFFEGISCPGLLLASSRSWEARKDRYKQRISSLTAGGNFKIQLLEGHHHQHLEGQVEQVADLLNEFFI